jgi:hypothetical protein
MLTGEPHEPQRHHYSMVQKESRAMTVAPAFSTESYIYCSTRSLTTVIMYIMYNARYKYYYYSGIHSTGTIEPVDNELIL